MRRAIIAQREATMEAEMELSRAIGYKHNIFDDVDGMDDDASEEED
jgi:hypothetical protein